MDKVRDILLNIMHHFFMNMSNKLCNFSFQSVKKRQVPPVVEKLLSVDIYMTDQFVKAMEKFLAFRQLKTHYKLLEVRKFHKNKALDDCERLALQAFAFICSIPVMDCYGSLVG